MKKNSDFLYKVLTIKSSYSLSSFLNIKISSRRNTPMNSLPVTPRHATFMYSECTYMRVMGNDQLEEIMFFFFQVFMSVLMLSL